MKSLGKILVFLAFISGSCFVLRDTAQGAETVLQVGFDPHLPPYQFIKDNEYQGVHIDLLNAIAQEEDLIIEYVPFDTMTGCMDALEEGKVDMVLGAILEKRGKRAQYGTETLSSSSVCMIVPKNKAEEFLEGKKMTKASYQEGTITFSFMTNIKNLRAIPVSNQERGMQLLLDNDVDAFVGVKSSVLYQLQERHLEDDYTIISNYMLPIEYNIQVREGDRELLEQLNRGIESIRISGKYADIHRKWVNENDYQLKTAIKRITVGVGAAGTAVLILTAVGVRINHILKKQVEEKTIELQEANEDLKKLVITTRNSNELRNCVIENSPSAIIVFDQQFKITLFNPSAFELAEGKKLESGRNILEYELFREILESKKEMLFQSQKGYQNQEFSRQTGAGEYLYYRYNLYLLFHPDQKVRGAILVIDDVTAENRLKEQTIERQKEEALTRMVAGIAHEIRNPLTAIKTYAELIPLKRDNAEFQNQVSQYIPREVERMNVLIQDLIDYAKPKKRQREWFLIEEVAESCGLLIRPMTRGKSVEFSMELEPGLLLWGDRGHFRQALVNLLLNGLEALERKKEPGENRRLCLKSWAENGCIYVQVSDEGIGMDEEEAEKAAEPFFTTKATGTGLGLSVCKQFAEENGGTMMIRSEKGKGTNITFCFKKNRGQ